MLDYFRNFPKHVFCILGNEFCERFSYYGMRAILVIYLWKAIGLEQNTATAIYHAFLVVSYFTPLIGAIIADSWLGKCKTILSISVIYAIGNIVMTISAIPFNGSYYIYGPAIGLLLIAFGTGGIKPCVSSFGGDQFSDDQKRQKDSFFSFFYMAVNIGSLISIIVTPTIRGDVYCYNTSCYCLAFGIPAILMVISIVVFAIGIKWYTKVPPSRSIITKFGGCCAKALVRSISCRRKNTEKKEHWLDYAEPDYDRQFISDVKDVTRVMWIFLPLPVFWALYDQQGSRWTLQATQMDGELGTFILQPDLLQAINPLLVVIFVPLLESVVFPCFEKCRMPFKPLQRIGVGMLFAALSFVVAAGIQVLIDRDFPTAIDVGQTKIRFINTSPCTTLISKDTDTQLSVTSFNSSDYLYLKAGSMNFDVSWTGCSDSGPIRRNISLNFNEKKAYHVYLGDDQSAHLFEQTEVSQTDDLESKVRFYNSLRVPLEIVSMKTIKNQEDEPRQIGRIDPQSVSKYESIILTDFSVSISLNKSSNSVQLPTKIRSQNGALYTIIICNRSSSAIPISTGSGVGDLDSLVLDVIQLIDIKPWSTSILLQIPQYVVLTIGECLFSVTGLAFAYTQAPVSMKSFLTSIWLMTTAIGNVVVIIVAESGSSLKQVYEFILFASLMFVTTIIFIIMALFYKYVDAEKGAKGLDATEESDSVNIGWTTLNDEKKPVAISRENQGIHLKKTEKAKCGDDDDDDDVVVTRM